MILCCHSRCPPCAARRWRSCPESEQHIDNLFIRIRGFQHYSWRVIDQDGVVLDILAQERRDSTGCQALFKRLLRGCTRRAQCHQVKPSRHQTHRLPDSPPEPNPIAVTMPSRPRCQNHHIYSPWPRINQRLPRRRCTCAKLRFHEGAMRCYL